MKREGIKEGKNHLRQVASHAEFEVISRNVFDVQFNLTQTIVALEMF